MIHRAARSVLSFLETSGDGFAPDTDTWWDWSNGHVTSTVWSSQLYPLISNDEASAIPLPSGGKVVILENLPRSEGGRLSSLPGSFRNKKIIPRA